MSELVWFAGVSGRVAGFGAQYVILAAGLRKQDCRHRRLHDFFFFFSKFYRHHCGLVSGFGVGLRSLLLV